MKSIVKAVLLMVMLVSANYVNADCTLTSSDGTDVRCFLQDGEYVCLERAEDTHCFTSSGTDPGSVG